ncbi:MAG: DNA-binding protein Alba [Candidatus Micrarchaeota archaeon]|nr:DNA-binding protein Alba [Candidatus Micrarchaeota archaeon]
MAEETTAAQPVLRKDDNTIYVGKKPSMGYVLAALTQFTNGATEIAVKARGKLTSKAIDVVQILKNRYMNDVAIKEVKIGTEELTGEDGRVSRVSIIEIYLKK